jgi:hypothetical protein
MLSINLELQFCSSKKEREQMEKTIKGIKRTIKVFIPKPFYQIYCQQITKYRIIKQWKYEGRPVPPPELIKRIKVKKYQKKYKTKMLIETGTFLGGMIDAQRRNFREIHTIELMNKYYNDAVHKFKNYKHIHCYKGDSSKVLWDIMPRIKGKALLWLDGHYSIDIFARGDKDCPVLEELEAIFSNDLKHIILIDDARDFTGIGDYPTVQQVKDFILSKNPKYDIRVENDIIVCTV